MSAPGVSSSTVGIDGPGEFRELLPEEALQWRKTADDDRDGALDQSPNGETDRISSLLTNNLRESHDGDGNDG